MGKYDEALLIKATGDVQVVDPENGTDFTLEELQGFVGGNIEIVRVPDDSDRIIILNEEGKLDGLPINMKATDLYQNPYDVIVGDVLVCRTALVK